MFLRKRPFIYSTITVAATGLSVFLSSSCGALLVVPTSCRGTSPSRTINSSRLFASKDNKNLSAAKQERREEERRRSERKEDVVIGKTSALPAAKDYAIDPKATEEAWMRQATNVEQEIYRQTERGMELLKMLRLEEASEAFDRVFELKPNAYLWHAGIAKYYQNDYEAAAEIFARSATFYESRFGEPASEERIWRDACNLKVFSNMKKMKQKALDESGGFSQLVAQIPERGEMDAFTLPTESRKVLRIARNLFSASVERSSVSEILNRAKLRSICGSADEQPRADRKMWKLNAWYYLGLHYDALGDTEESKECMKMALRLCPSSGNGNDIIHTLPMVHMARRDWYDDDAFEEDSAANSVNVQVSSNPNQPLVVSPELRGTRTDPVIIDSIRKSVWKMRVNQIQDALKTRGLKNHGSKEVLADKLFRSLLEDVGLD